MKDAVTAHLREKADEIEAYRRRVRRTMERLLAGKRVSKRTLGQMLGYLSIVLMVEVGALYDQVLEMEADDLALPDETSAPEGVALH